MRNRDYTPPYMRIDVEDPASPKGSADRFLDFLREELILQVEREFRTERPRMLSGWSGSGLFAFYSHLAEPGLFDARFAHSTPLWREEDVVLEQLKQEFDKAIPLSGFFFVSIGDNENEGITGAFHRLRTLLETALGQRLAYLYQRRRSAPNEPAAINPCGSLRFSSSRMQLGGELETETQD